MPERLINYLKSHWAGQQSIRQTLWLNFLIPAAVLYVIQKLLLQPLVDARILPATAVILFLLAAYLSLALAVCVALNRRQRILAGGYATNGDVVFANGGVLIVVMYLLVSLTDVLTGRTGEVTINAESGLRINPPNENPTYTTISEEKGIYSLSGSIGIGATKRFNALLEKQNVDRQPPELLLIESEGGNIFEARGIAKLVRDHSLATHVDQQCLSACTLIFVSGMQRTADAQARFGFHAYRLDSKHAQVWLDSGAEQDKDEMIFLNSNVDPDFVRQIYQTAPDALWIPSHQELKAARFLYSETQ